MLVSSVHKLSGAFARQTSTGLHRAGNSRMVNLI